MYIGLQVKHPLFLSHVLRKLELSQQIFEKLQLPNFMKIPSMGAKLFQADARTDIERHDEASGHFPKCCERA